MSTFKWTITDEDQAIVAEGDGHRIIVVTDAKVITLADDPPREAVELLTYALSGVHDTLIPGGALAQAVHSARVTLRSATDSEAFTERLGLPTVTMVLDIVRKELGDEAAAKVKAGIAERLAPKG